jgi:hypothetical protein
LASGDGMAWTPIEWEGVTAVGVARLVDIKKPAWVGWKFVYFESRGGHSFAPQLQ